MSYRSRLKYRLSGDGSAQQGACPWRGKGKRNSDLSEACANAPAKLANGSSNYNPTWAATNAPDAGHPSLPTLWTLFRFGSAPSQAVCRVRSRVPVASLRRGPDGAGPMPWDYLHREMSHPRPIRFLSRDGAAGCRPSQKSLRFLLGAQASRLRHLSPFSIKTMQMENMTF